MQIQKLFDESILNMSKPWIGKLTFPVFRWCDGLDHNVMFSNLPENIDICEYLNGDNGSSDKLYFCRKEYPPPSDQSKINECSGRKDLRRKIEKLALDCGNPIVSNES